MQWDEKELDTQFTPNVYFWTPNSEILAKALQWTLIITSSLGPEKFACYITKPCYIRVTKTIQKIHRGHLKLGTTKITLL